MQQLVEQEAFAVLASQRGKGNGGAAQRRRAGETKRLSVRLRAVLQRFTKEKSGDLKTFALWYVLIIEPRRERRVRERRFSNPAVPLPCDKRANRLAHDMPVSTLGGQSVTKFNGL